MNEFLEQLPIAPFASFCGVVVVALVLLIVLSTVMRRNRSAKETPVVPNSENQSAIQENRVVAKSEEKFLFESDDEFLSDEPLPDMLDLLHPASNVSKQVATQSRKMTPVFSVLRDENEGRLVLQMDGVTYQTLVDEPEIRSKFIGIVKELSEVVNKPYDKPADVEASPVYNNIVDINYDQVEAAQSLPPEPTFDDAILTDKPAQSSGDIPGALPTYNLEDSSTITQGRFGRTKYEPKPIPELNIAAAIEDFLQFKLLQTPAYAGREIHVHNAPGGFVRIQVDDHYYDEVGQVDDEAIRSFLSETIQEWQKNQQR